MVDSKNVGGVVCTGELVEEDLPHIIAEKPFTREGKEYVRRDYSDGFTELYFYDTERGCWLVEGYRNKQILGMPYNFDWCLSSNVLCGLYLESVKIIKNKKHFPVFSC
jgi:hypothetical protein